MLDPAVHEQVNDAITVVARFANSRHLAAVHSAVSGVDLPLSAVALLRQLDGGESLRLSELSRRLSVALPPLSRQVRTLEGSGFVDAPRTAPTPGRACWRSPQPDAMRCAGSTPQIMLCSTKRSPVGMTSRSPHWPSRCSAWSPIYDEEVRSVEPSAHPTAFFLPTGPETFHATTATQGPWDPNAMHGGPPAEQPQRFFSAEHAFGYGSRQRVAFHPAVSTSWARVGQRSAQPAPRELRNIQPPC